MKREGVLKWIDSTLTADMLLESSSDEDDSSTENDTSESSEESSSDDDMFMLSIRALVKEKRYLSLRKHRPKTKELANFIFRADDKTFKKEARMSREAFFGILEKIRSHSVFQNKARNDQTDPADQFMVALGRLGFHGNAASLWNVGTRFGVGEGTVKLFTFRIIQSLLSLESDVVSWPNMQERDAIKERIKEKFKFPNCIGMVDGTLIGLESKPVKGGEDYYTRKGNYALNAMIICDDQRRIRHVMAGFPGGAHDCRVFLYSKIAKNSPKYFTTGEYLLADSAYPVSEITVAPYKKPAASTSENEKFNFYHSRTRIAAEHTIGILKGRFKSLKSLRINIGNKKDHAWAVYWIRACCVLHNLLQNDEYDESWLEPDEDEPLGRFVVPESSERGQKKREALKRIVLRV